MATSNSQSAVAPDDGGKSSRIVGTVAFGVLELVVAAFIWTWAGLWLAAASWNVMNGQIVPAVGIVVLMVIPAVIVQYHRLTGQVLPNRVRAAFGRLVDVIGDSGEGGADDGIGGRGIA